MKDILDPTLVRPVQRIQYVARPTDLRGLRIGLVDSTKKNAEAVLSRIADRLRSTYGMSCDVLVHKHQRAPLTDAQIAAVKDRVDFVIVGVGD